MEAPSGFGYPHFATLAICVPWSGRPLPPELPIAFKNCSPPMNNNTIYFETHGMNIDAARNFFAEKAIEHKARYIFMWDEDVLLPGNAIRELCYVADNWPNVGVVAGIYCLKVDHPEPMVFKDQAGGVYWDWKVGEVFECAATSMGCTLIRTEMLKDLEKPYFRTVDDMTPYLDGVPMGEQWTEDLYFCRKVTDTKKWKVVAHGGLVMPHVDVRTGRRYELPPDSKPAKHLILPVGKKKIIDIGAGPNPLKTDEGTVIAVDIRGDVGADYRADFRRLPFATGEFDIVYSSHALEHIPRADTQAALTEWARILKADGEMRLVLPNLEWAAKRILAGEYGMANGTNVTAFDVFYGAQSYAEDFHKNGFTPKNLDAMLRKLGFRYFKTETPVFNIVMRAWRQKPKKKK